MFTAELRLEDEDEVSLPGFFRCAGTQPDMSFLPCYIRDRNYSCHNRPEWGALKKKKKHTHTQTHTHTKILCTVETRRLTPFPLWTPTQTRIVQAGLAIAAATAVF